MEVRFQTKITTGILYDYMLRHTYNSPSGLIGSVAGAVFIIAFFAKGHFLYLLAGAFLLLYLPGSLFLSAARQMKQVPAFQKPLSYRLCEDGIEVSQSGESQMQSWEKVYKVVSTGKSIILYNNKVNAWIFPRKDMGEVAPKVIEMISTHVSPQKVKIRW